MGTRIGIEKRVVWCVIQKKFKGCKSNLLKYFLYIIMITIQWLKITNIYYYQCYNLNKNLYIDYFIITLK